MSPVPVSPRRVFGVDFSAASDAGDRTWICRAHPGSDGIRIESVDPLSELPGGARDLRRAMSALVARVLESPRSAWGFDFSFGLPAPMLDALALDDEAYGAQLDALALGDEAYGTQLDALALDDEAYGAQLDAIAACGDADNMRARCDAIGGGAQLRRRTDIEAATPFAPHNLRIYKQTFHGMVDVVRPLRARPEVVALPFDALPVASQVAGERLPFHHAAGGAVPHIYLMEVCPASVLKKLGISAQGYKGAGAAQEAQRRAILGQLTAADLVRPARRAVRDRIARQSGGDALDAVIAAVGAWRGYRGYDHQALRAEPAYRREGFVYT